MLGQTDLPTRQPATHGCGSVCLVESHPVSTPLPLTDDAPCVRETCQPLSRGGDCNSACQWCDGARFCEPSRQVLELERQER
ncbi:hypothetical protein HBI56_154860 [Parastagonospora nodorum]|nr:hypothetical protein HBH98_104990 [Parastagonospora nodorum]KAH4385838.1 hypothetical protein HBH97_066580 [Parastagonospora nodorum]KAH4399548.1 hypothetical protein HBH99_097960 [Parastagonospora nodorum]KAH4938221.1 hypothetical protein HBH73_166460 [Parastagonospora nodorum]KAH4943804.1 hypothetical protein HBH74_057200 [Parastagonospora nodorum]